MTILGNVFMCIISYDDTIIALVFVVREQDWVLLKVVDKFPTSNAFEAFGASGLGTLIR